MSKEILKRQLKIDGTVLLGVVLIMLLYRLLGVGCPIRAYTGVPCPTCGMTRSVNALIHGDFAASFRDHALTIPTVGVLLLALHENLFPGLKKWIFRLEIAMGCALLLYYFYRLRLGLIP